MKRTLYLRLARGLIVGLFGLAASAAFSTDVYAADDPDHPGRNGESRVKVQIFFIPGDSTTPPTITRVILHAAGRNGGGGDACTGFNDCAGLVGKMLADPIIVYPASGTTCVTVNYGGMWRTICF